MLFSTIKNALFFFTFFLFACNLPGGEKAFASPDPTEQFKPFLEKVVGNLADPALKKLSKKEQAAHMITVVKERFDFTEMSKRVLNPKWRELSAQEQNEFQDLFTQLLQFVYVGKIEDYSGQKVQFTQQRMRGPRAEVQTELVDANRSIAISYLLKLENGQWMAYDVVVEGMSLVRNYREEFIKIITNDGYPQLVKQIQSKVNELEKQYTEK
jgi:phospholipid transport system substrate-binding protein